MPWLNACSGMALQPRGGWCSRGLLEWERQRSPSAFYYDTRHGVSHALNLFYLLTSDIRFRHVFFVDGFSERSIENGLVTRIGSIGGKYSRSSASEALEVLSNPDHEVTRDWAIIYDGVDNPEINIGRYFPSCAFGTIVITTRNANLETLDPIEHIRLQDLTPEKAAEGLLLSATDGSAAKFESDRPTEGVSGASNQPLIVDQTPNRQRHQPTRPQPPRPDNRWLVRLGSFLV
jgi:hypothetical protein